KFRGQRIELGEIEAALRSHPDVAGSVVLVHTDAATGDHLVAYVVGADSPEPVALREHAARLLPTYMLPSVITVLDEFPLNASGKLDRKALPEPDFAAAHTEYVPPRTPAEEAVAAVFADVLGGARVGVHDDFFALGGTSLSATQVVSRLRGAGFDSASVREVFDAPTVASLAAALGDEQTTAGHLGSDAPALVRRARSAGERLPLAPAQQRIWFLNQFDPADPVHNLPLVIRFDGELDTDALVRALAAVVAKHEPLRTVFPASSDGPYQHILEPDAVSLDVAVDRAASTDLDARVDDVLLRGFDVTTELPIRARLFRLTDDSPAGVRHVLAIVLHHIAADGWSFDPLARDVAAAYAATASGAPTLPEPAVRFGDYTLWQRDMLGDVADPTSTAARQLAHWRTALADLPALLELPTDRPRPAVASSAGAGFSVRLDAALTDAVAALARGRGATSFMVMHAALSVVLARLSGTVDIAIGTPIAGRGDAALDDLVGMFANTLVLRAHVDPAAEFDALLAAVRTDDLAAFAHADLPFEQIVEALDPVRSSAFNPLFQVALFYQNHRAARLELPGLTVSSTPVVPDVAPFDLQFVLTEDDDRSTRVDVTYATALYDDATARGFAAAFVRVLETVVARPDAVVGDVPLGETPEPSPGTHTAPVPALTHPDLFARQVARTPDALALVDGDGDVSLTYAELDAAVTRLARRLVAAGVGPEVRVAVAIRRSAALVVAMYAVARAGGAYVPIDPDHPRERIEHVLRTAAPRLTLTTVADGLDAGTGAGGPVLTVDEPAAADHGDDSEDSEASKDAARWTDAERLAPLHPDNTVYVLFTSGSTGTPKGVAVTHAAVVHQVTWMQSRYPLGGDDAYLQKTAATFDLSVWGYLWPLTTGARVVLAAPDGHRDPDYLARTIDEQSVTATDFVPSMLDAFLSVADPARARGLRHVFAIGEALPAATAARFRDALPAQLHNLYGPTEATVSVTEWDPREGDPAIVPIGVVEANVRAYVLDARLHPCAPGVPGE
ncbi:AMP-binding protein, partial [Rhodococcus sp. HNM0569]|uniref:AMP-binding protein n=1 Tax=Rhodococcus sp. HNM0569 TaxID=2716340 RepID=UPI00146D5BBF